MAKEHETYTAYQAPSQSKLCFHVLLEAIYKIVHDQ